MLDVRSQMGIAGDLGRLTQFQTAQAIPEAAKAGGAGDAMGLGAGIALGQQMAASMASNLGQQQKQQEPAAPQQTASAPCPKCNKPVPLNAKFCPECGTAQQLKCPQCGQPVEGGAKFCPECGKSLK